MKASIRANTVWIFAGLSLFMGIFFLMPSGAPSVSGTPHIQLKGLTARFSDSKNRTTTDAATGSFGQNTGRQETPAERIASLLRERLPQHEVEGILAYLEKQDKRRTQLEKEVALRKKMPTIKQKRRAIPPVSKQEVVVEKKIAPEIPKLVPVRQVQVSPEDLMRAWYDADLSKFPLNLEIRKAGIICVLEGLSHWKAHDSYVVRLRLENRTNTDFFVGDIYVSDGEKRLRADRYFDLFVGPGTSKTALVAFARPQSGAVVHISIKEDVDGDRLLLGRIDYPF